MGRAAAAGRAAGGGGGLADLLPNCVNGGGEVFVSCQVHRTQEANLAECFDKLEKMVRRAATRPKVRSLRTGLSELAKSIGSNEQAAEQLQQMLASPGDKDSWGTTRKSAAEIAKQIADSNAGGRPRQGRWHAARRQRRGSTASWGSTTAAAASKRAPGRAA